MDSNLKQKFKELLDALDGAKGRSKASGNPYDLSAKVNKSRGRGTPNTLPALEQIVRFSLGILLTHQKRIADIRNKAESLHRKAQDNHNAILNLSEKAQKRLQALDDRISELENPTE